MYNDMYFNCKYTAQILDLNYVQIYMDFHVGNTAVLYNYSLNFFLCSMTYCLL